MAKEKGEREGDCHLHYIGAQVNITLKRKLMRLARRQDLSVSQVLRAKLKELVRDDQ